MSNMIRRFVASFCASFGRHRFSCISYMYMHVCVCVFILLFWTVIAAALVAGMVCVYLKTHMQLIVQTMGLTVLLDLLLVGMSCSRFKMGAAQAIVVAFVCN